MNDKLKKIIDAHRGGYTIELPYVGIHEMIADFVAELDEQQQEIDSLSENFWIANKAAVDLGKKLTEATEALTCECGAPIDSYGCTSLDCQAKNESLQIECKSLQSKLAEAVKVLQRTAKGTHPFVCNELRCTCYIGESRALLAKLKASGHE